MSLSPKSKAIILGSVLGDGSLRLHSKYRNARFSFRHSIKQKEYFYWKVEQLSEISARQSVFEQASDGFSSKKKLRFQSAALPELTELYNLIHQKGKFVIRRKWLNQMNELSLAIWWFDDGSLIGNGRKGVICTDNFRLSSQKILARYLQVVWGIRVQIGVVNGEHREIQKKDKYFRLNFYSSSELEKFLRIILPYLPVEKMIYKVLLLYKDARLQQRWISEVTRLSGFPLRTVEKALKEKKSRWKAFRE
jgi:hypothetical protein